MAFAVAMPPSIRTTGSLAPWMTRAGQETPASAAFRLPEARIAAICRSRPAGWTPRAKTRTAWSLPAFGSKGYLGPQYTCHLRRYCAMNGSSSVSRGSVRHAHASGVDGGRPGSPVLDMIDVSVSTRSGWPAARSWAIMPPIERPTTCAFSMPSASSNPTVSATRSDNR